MDITDHFVEGAARRLKGRTGGPFEQPPEFIVIHYTATAGAASAIRTLSRDATSVSAHLVIDTDGSVTQIVPFSHVAWHAGRSAWDGRTGLNKWSIGLELVNCGYLEADGPRFVSVYNNRFEADEVMLAQHRNERAPRYWQRYAPEQLEATLEICEALMDTYPSIRQIVGHDEISPGRKSDPGPAFPMQKFRDRLVEGRRDEDGPPLPPPVPTRGVVTASALNVREAPVASAARAADALTKGTRVKILRERDGWYEIEIPSSAWVSARYVEPEAAPEPASDV